MASKLENKIEANNTSINALLKEQKFYIDYFQREYRWQEKHIQLLVEDLTTTFLKSYTATDKRSSVENYQNYYLGPFVFSINPDSGKKSIIDGQQRITSITLLLIHLNHLQKKHEQKVVISGLIFSEKYGDKSFNMTDEMRAPCLKSLFEDGEYELKEDDDETIKNMVERYSDIVQSFPEELAGDALPYFIDWFIGNVVIVEITAYSDENAYTIFETMNDRGLNLTPSEMLKGYVLSKITDQRKKTEINDIWKKEIQNLHSYGENTDQAFFQAWFRGKYAVEMRPSKAGSENKDFELIGSKFHSWFKDNHKKLFKLETSDDFYHYFRKDFPFFVKWYIESRDAQKEYNKDIPHVHYINYWGIAESLQDPLLLASINVKDDKENIYKKFDLTARYIETFTVRRAINYRKFSQSSIKSAMFSVIKLIRNKELNNLATSLGVEVDRMEQKWDTVVDFGLHGQNRKFVKHLLSRISGYIDSVMGKSTGYVDYQNPEGKQFEIEHIWGNKFSEHRDEFDQKNEFHQWRNSIGALILLPNGANQSYSNDPYEDKIDHYIKENAYAQTLHHNFYEKNPNFLNSPLIRELAFKSHPAFKKEDIEARSNVVKRVCEQIWSTSFQIEVQENVKK